MAWECTPLLNSAIDHQNGRRGTHFGECSEQKRDPSTPTSLPHRQFKEEDGAPRNRERIPDAHDVITTTPCYSYVGNFDSIHRFATNFHEEPLEIAVRKGVGARIVRIQRGARPRQRSLPSSHENCSRKPVHAPRLVATDSLVEWQFVRWFVLTSFVGRWSLRSLDV